MKNLTLKMFRKLITKVLIFLLCVSIVIHFGTYMLKDLPGYSELDQRDLGARLHFMNVDKFYRYRATWPTSVLGGILFKREHYPLQNPNADKTFVVLVWKHWNWLKHRHVENYGKRDELYIFEDCSVNNCIFSGDDSLIDTADAVLVHLQKGEIPEVENRNRKQRWIFLNDESPRNAFSLKAGPVNLSKYYNIFNWSMTYRSDADVPVPYGRTIARDAPVMTYLTLPDIAALVPNWHKKIKYATTTVLMSNCGVKDRNNFLTELRKYIDVDVYGKCSDNIKFRDSCPGHFKKDCEPVEKYLFYLVLENANCHQYMTEKIFYHAYSKGAIPIIWGPYIEDVESLLPPNSYLYADETTNVKTLADTMKNLAKSTELLISMHMWRNNYKILNEHGYFGTKSYHLCRLCEALNYNEDKEKIYGKERIDAFLDPELSCGER